MTKLSLTALMVWALCFSGANCGAAKVQGPQTEGPKAPKAEQPASPTVKLTAEHPSASLPVSADIFVSDPEVLEVSITKVENTAKTPISIFVYLTMPKQRSLTPRRFWSETSVCIQPIVRGSSC